jgi:putative ABC transport system permease protein
LRKNAGFALVAVLSLGFGIGAATTMFSVVDTLDFRPLPYADAGRLVWLSEVAPPDDPMCPNCGWPTSVATARDWLSQVHSYDAIAVTDHTSLSWEHDDVEESSDVGLTTPGLLTTLGLRPALGRDFATRDTIPGAEPVVLLTYEFWQTRFGGDPNIVGAQLRARMGAVNAAPRLITVIGVLPREFEIMPHQKLWGTMSLGGHGSRAAREVTVIGRLKPGIGVAGATAELQGLSARLGRLYPKEYRGWRARVEPLRDRLAWGAGQGRGVLFVITAVVLLIAVLNVTGLLFGRAAARQSEFAMRAALGASGARLFRQLLVEGSCIGVFGGVIGIAFAFAGVHLASRWFSIEASGLSLRVDSRMLSFATAVSLIVGIAAAMAPAVRIARMDAAANLRPRATGGSRATHTSSVLVTAQIALAFVLLTAAVLLSRDFVEVRYLDLGYDPHDLFDTWVSAPREQWAHPEAWRPVVAEMRQRVAAAPGVASASIEYLNAMHPAVVQSDVSFGSPPDEHMPIAKAVDPDFFKTWNNPVLVGRRFAASDRAGAPLVAIVNRACATALWPGRNPIGRRVFLGDSATVGEWLTVVGVVEDIERDDLAERHSPVVYRPFAQAPLYHAAVRVSVRVGADRPDALTAAQAAIREVTGRASAPFANDEEYLRTHFLARRMNAIALDLFAGFGLLLAAMGIYGSIAFAVTRRTREIGIRMALGAARTSVLGLIARRGVMVAAAGTTIGASASIALTRVFKSFVVMTSVTNPWIFGASICVVLAVALVATLVPARRATTVNPVISLRAE